MVRLGEALTELDDPPVKALFVYNSNPAAVAPNQSKVLAGLRRDDLFVAVHEQVMTDTCRYADVVFPATSILEQLDLHKAYGHLYVQLSEPAIEPLGEAVPNTELFRRLAARMRFDEPAFEDSDEELVRQALETRHPNMAGISYERLRRDGWARVEVPTPFAPFAEGNFPTPSGKCEFWSDSLAARGEDPLPAYLPPYESKSSNAALAARYPLAFISPPARDFLNSSFANLSRYTDDERRPHLVIHPDDANARGIASGDPVRIFNDRGSLLAIARVSDRARRGLVVAPSVWWRRLAPGGENANAVTSQALTDMGGGPTFYDCLVEVTPA
jgi:anaerobic selenocysteine-containing dehydrogenase